MNYYAHSENKYARKHLLSRHLTETAKLAESFACREELKFVFHLAGLLHDFGKYQPDFQRYLENNGKRGSVPHASWGAGYARCKGLLETSFAIDGHHKGLPDKSAWKGDTEPFKRGDVIGYEEVFKRFIEDSGIDEVSIDRAKFPVFAEPLENEAFIRYLFSALTDSDWLSTERHFDEEASRIRLRDSVPLDEMAGKLDLEFSKKPQKGEINRMRNEARLCAIQKAELPCGFYSLTLPTGMGKTLTSMAWALKHAKKNALKRIIVVLPFVNIIDQTAQILKDIFGEDRVLEHHSSYAEDGVPTRDGEGSYSFIEQQKKLACENWDYPVIVTTTVQFFESLFSNKPRRCRKIHNIAESIVIFDEVQTFPKEVILPTLQMLKDVHSVMNTSFLFCTATQPAFEKRRGFEGIDNIHPLIEDPSEIFRQCRRVTYHLLNDLAPVDSRTLLDAATHDGRSTLVIFNTKKAALEFYNCAKDCAKWERKYHLSTSMCPAHRKEVIKNIRTDLGAKKTILVASTQLIEAGVDFDFPLVFRAMAPLEAIIQAAGRCNRENELGLYGGRVFLFKMVDGAMPDKTYASCAAHAEELLRADGNQLHSHHSFKQYYSQVLRLYVDPDRYKINDARRRFNFQTVNDSYHIIRDQTETLFIYQYNEESDRLLQSVEHKAFLSRDDFRKMQAYTVQVYNHFIIQNGSMCQRMPQGFTVWHGSYDAATGISVEPLKADNLIV